MEGMRIMANNELRVFVARKNEDVGLYINVVTYAVNFLDVGNIKFIKLEHNDTLEDFDIENYVRNDINDKLRSLAKANPDYYQKAFDVFSNSGDKELTWDYLLIKREIKKSSSGNVFYDLTSLPKAVCLDIFVKLISCDVENIINFERLNTGASKTSLDELNRSEYRVVRCRTALSFSLII